MYNSDNIPIGIEPVKGTGEYWKWKRRREAINNIKKAEKAYNMRDDVIIFLVANWLKFDKAPGHREVYREYLLARSADLYKREIIPSYLDILPRDMLQ